MHARTHTYMHAHIQTGYTRESFGINTLTLLTPFCRPHASRTHTHVVLVSVLPVYEAPGRRVWYGRVGMADGGVWTSC